MYRSKIIIIAILLSACSPQAIPTTQILEPTSTIHSAATNTAQNTATTLPTETATSISTNSSFQLPPDCSNFDSSIDPIYYQDLSDGACNHPTLSPDGSSIAYASLVKVMSDTGTESMVQEARVFSISLSQSNPVYVSKCGNLYPEWAPTGYLVISDFPQDVGCEQTIIFDPVEDKIVFTLDGAVTRSWRSYWSKDRNAFFTLSPVSFDPICHEDLSGFDLISNKPFPSIKPITPNTNIYVVIGDPIWSSEDQSLLALIRDGTCSNEENMECTYGNSYIISISLTGSTPTISYPYYDSEVDYSFIKSGNVITGIDSAPTKILDCWDVQAEDGR